MREALAGIDRCGATVQTSKYRYFRFIDSRVVPDQTVVVIGLSDGFALGVLSSRIHEFWSLRSGGWLGVGNDPRYSTTRCFDTFPFPDCWEKLTANIGTVAEELDAHRKARQAMHPDLTVTQMYNVLEKIRKGEDLTQDDERIKTDALILILKELHDKLDAFAFKAYGWPETLSDEEILERLVALNKQRAAEEKAGTIRWLRPDYQIPRFGSEAEKARLAEERREARALSRASQVALDLDDDLQEMKPRFPTGNELDETASVMRVLGSAAAPISIEEITKAFAQGKSIEKRVAATVGALVRLGHLTSSDDGKTFALRRVA